MTQHQPTISSCRSAFLLAAYSLASTGNAALVLTHHNDNYRTGANLNETILKPSNVSSKTFRKLFSRDVDGQIYAQPLYAENVLITKVGPQFNTVHNIVIVATMHNTVYAWDADSNGGSNYYDLWHTSLGPSYPAASHPGPPTGGWNQNNSNIWPEVGVLSTPAIDAVAGTVYAVAKKGSGPADAYFHLFKMDLGSGDLLTSTIISGNVPGIGEDSSGGLVYFKPQYHNNRPALLLANGLIYAAFGSIHDRHPFHGWVFAYDSSSLARVAIFCTTPDAEGGGIWQSGNGLAADESGYIYLLTGNGRSGVWWSDRNGVNFAQSFVKLTPQLGAVSVFTLDDQGLDDRDMDLGSSGPTFVPGTNAFVGGGKHNVFYVWDRNRSGRYYQPFYQFTFNQAGEDPGTTGFGHTHGGPTLWTNSSGNRFVYVWREQSKMGQRLVYPTGGLVTIEQSPTTQSIYAPPGMPGGTQSISSLSGYDGIVWSTLQNSDSNERIVSGTLHAFEANDLSHELWNSTINTGDEVGLYAKFCPPTVANGKVYLATFSNKLHVYGLSLSPELIMDVVNTILN
jgi:hypothetical protein